MRRVGSDEELSEEEVMGRGIELGDTWEAIGPFPSGMREHALIGSPLHAFVPNGQDADIAFVKLPNDLEQTWPSELADGGRVGWKRFTADKDGWVSVSYPEIRWSQLRGDHGWASLQYSAILRTSVTIPNDDSSEFDKGDLIPILIDAVQLVEYALVPESSNGPVDWHTGDVYNFTYGTETGHRHTNNNPASNFSRSLALAPGRYTLLVRAVYECRMFGDPGDGPPIIKYKIHLAVDEQTEVALVPGIRSVPGIVCGWLLGDWLSVGFRVPATGKSVEVMQVSCEVSRHGAQSSITTVTVELVDKVVISPGQVRSVPIKIKQDKPLARLATLKVMFVVKDIETPNKMREIHWLPDFETVWTDKTPFKITFASPVEPRSGIPAQVGYAVVVPPRNPDDTVADLCNAGEIPVILALHGAGVDVEWNLWPDAMPQVGAWCVLPTGKNEWGEDWHGASMADSWAAREALNRLLPRLGHKVSQQTLILGHSNGGQGAWHLAARYPDKVVAVLAAAAYVKIQDYVPYTELTSAKHADPALLGILESSLAPYNNDLHLSNLVGVSALAYHGGADTNVPPRHARVLVGLVNSWQGRPDAVQVVEVPGKDHFWDGMFESPDIVKFLRKALAGGPRSWDEERKQGFTLTAVNPEECGGRAGIRIVELEVPGRMARLDVNAPHWRDGSETGGIDLRGMNIKRIEMVTGSSGAVQVLEKQRHGFKVSEAESYVPRAYGPLIRVLATTAPLKFVVGKDNEQHVSIARRLAHDVLVYHRLDSDIFTAYEALELVATGDLPGNVVVIGRPEDNIFAEWMVAQKNIPLRFPTRGVFELAERLVYERGSGIITLHPHPTDPRALAVLLAGNDSAGLSSAARLFPIRTGVPVPEWAIVGPRMGWQAAGGLIGAGFWSGTWGWSDGMSWIDR